MTVTAPLAAVPVFVTIQEKTTVPPPAGTEYVVGQFVGLVKFVTPTHL